MCFAPQRRALFRHLNFPKWSERAVCLAFLRSNVLRARTACTFSTAHIQEWSNVGVFCTFWRGNVLRATTVCNFSSLIWPAGSAPAALARLLFDPPEPQIIRKHTVNRDFPTFSHTCIFLLLPLSLLWSSHFFSSPLWLFPPLLFQLSILLEVSLLNFLRSLI